MLKSIEIDFDIHKLIEAERRGFDEPEYVALRRLLGLPEVQPEKVSVSLGRPFLQDGVSIPHGAEARMAYGRGSQLFEGQFLDGALVVNGERFTSLSAAACALATTRDGGQPSLNGWNYWEARLPGESVWKRMKDLRSGAQS